MKNRMLVILFLTTIGITILNCTAEKSANKPRIISVIPKGTTHAFWQSIHAGAVKAGKRESGFLQIIKKYPGIEIASAEQYGGATKASAQAAAENLLLRFRTANGDFPIDGIFV